MFANWALGEINKNKKINTILDVGSGIGKHSRLFARYGKNVIAVDIADSDNENYNHDDILFVISDFMKFDMSVKVDCVWVSHLLEHQPNINLFLKKCLSLLKEGGLMAITVPPAKNQIVGGHLTVWNAGLVMYNLILAGTSCRHAHIKRYGYNISVIVQYEPITLPKLKYDNGDIESLSKFFPNGHNYQGFNGDIDYLCTFPSTC
jgi:2-polyprenyl-3-methyl-5-hydroxy-6-metoxy-1,4-benzoquinol methylase